MCFGKYVVSTKSVRVIVENNIQQALVLWMCSESFSSKVETTTFTK